MFLLFLDLTWDLLLASKMELGLQRKPANQNQRDSEEANSTHLNYWRTQNTLQINVTFHYCCWKAWSTQTESISGNNNANLKKKKDDSLMKNSLDCFMSVLLPIKCFEHLSKYKKKKKPRPYDLQQCLRNT